ncbi:hypothetical protein [Siphonobacter sp. BAB-5405]|uniref:hypothetical protein n=1 Tax=Siphonobacter sp. BAB-5405 TaxID=1864825 RepID=UPI00130503E1|nr:hypothetical protein [Siphonobacter sp. BAB-5405]
MSDEEKWELLINTTKRFLAVADPKDQEKIDGLLERLKKYLDELEKLRGKGK